MLAIPLRFVPLVVAMLCLAAAPSPAWAQNEREFFRYSEQIAFASFTSSVSDDPTGCLVNFVEVRVFDDTRVMRKVGPGKPFKGGFPVAGVSIVEFNTCTPETTAIYACSSEDTTGFDVSPSLDWATIETTMSCFDPANVELPPFEITVDITWEATGPVARFFRHERLTDTEAKTHTLIRAARRDAVATGSILLNGENLIPDESDDAAITAERRMTHSLPK